MIDLHSHILPGLDDGSRTIEETFNLIKEAEEVGFEAIISTSHYMEGYYETNAAEREVWLQSIEKNLPIKNIGMKLYLGNEIYFSEHIIQLLEERRASTINDTSYQLINHQKIRIIHTFYSNYFNLVDNEIINNICKFWCIKNYSENSKNSYV